MSLLSSYRKQQLLARHARKVVVLEKLYDAIDAAAIAQKSYKFDSGEGSQSAIYRDIEDLQKTIDSVEAQIDWIQGKLCGTGLVNFVLRRKQHNYL